MKQKFISVCLLLLSIGFFSCSQDDKIYSCNKDVNAWVKENLADIQMMSRSDWLNLDTNLKRAVYVAFTSEQKFLFWKGKIAEVLTLDWNEAEKKHLELLYETISDNPQWFTADISKNEEEFEKFELFEYRWSENAKDNLGWDKHLIGSIVFSGNKLLNTKGELQTENTSIFRADYPECECSKQSDWCANPSSYCGGVGGVCYATSSGCGFLWGYQCDGMCG